MKLELAQYREMAAFAQFGSDLDASTQQLLNRGSKLTELLKQKQYSPMTVAEMGLVLFAVEKGYLKDVELNKIADYESALISYMTAEHKEFMEKLAETGEYSDEVVQTFTDALEKFKTTQTY